MNSKFSYNKKYVLFVLFFAFIFASASLSKDQIRKVRQFKYELLNKDNEQTPTTSGEEIIDNKSEDSKKSEDVPISKDDSKFTNADSLSVVEQNSQIIENFNVSPQPTVNQKIIQKRLRRSSSHIDKDETVYESREKNGQIGVTSEDEQDRISDNFFTIDIPKQTTNVSAAYLTYELYGLANHQSVSRSINKNPSLGGQIISPKYEWSNQKEAINLNLLYEGKNTILFTAPAKGVVYKVKNVNIVFEHQSMPTTEENISVLRNGNQLYIKGFFDNSFSNYEVTIDGQSMQAFRGEFEKSLDLTQEQLSKGNIRLNASGSEFLIEIPTKETDLKIISSELLKPNTLFIEKDKEQVFNYEGAKIIIEKENILEQPAVISFLKLRGKDFPTTNQEIKNVTLEGRAYRLKNEGELLSKKVKVSIPYDEKLLGNFSAKEIKAFYFDYNTKKWMLEHSSIVDTENKTVTFESNGDQDYINGVISVPESPQLNAFSPTSISGLKAVNPTSGIPLINPPTASQKGDANVNYPLILPAGVNGLQPSLSVSYSSGGGNGWMGEGWNISGLSSISVDTRWGVPTFTPGNESELYSLDGEMLIYPNNYLPHRHNGFNTDNSFNVGGQSRSGSTKTFYLRKNHDFTKIERKGSGPGNYYWIVTGTDGTKTYYGGATSVAPNAVVKNNDGNIVQWGVYRIDDVYGNKIHFRYTNINATGFNAPDENINGGKIFQIDKIYYGSQSTNIASHPYIIEFSNSTTVRKDKSLNARQGLKRVEPNLLGKIRVKYKSSSINHNIRDYDFTYITGKFGKSLLSKMTYYAVGGITDPLSFTYDFDYYDDVDSNVFGGASSVSTPDTKAFHPIVESITTPSKISADNNFEWGWSLRTGSGLAILLPKKGGDKNFMLSMYGGASYPRTKKGQELIDFNGDGVADILYRERNNANGIKLIPGSLNGSGGLSFNGSSTENVGNLNSNFTRTEGTSWNIGGSVIVNWFRAGLDFSLQSSSSKSETDVFMMDANADGLPDVIKDGKVWFNKKGDNGQEMVTTSDLTENMIITGNLPEPYVEPVDPNSGTEPTIPTNDVVKVWIAPKDGFIKVTDQIAIAAGQGSSVDAVYSIEMKDPNTPTQNCRIYLKKLIGTSSQSISITNYSASVPLGANSSGYLQVQTGDKVYFRLHKRNGENYIVNTNPKVQYTSNGTTVISDTQLEEQDGYQPNNTDYQQKFFLNNLTRSLIFDNQTDADIHITAPGFSVPPLTDDVKFSIFLEKQYVGAALPQNQQQAMVLPVYEKDYFQGDTNIDLVDIHYTVPANNPTTPNGVSETWHLKFLVETSSHINNNIEWKNLIVQGYPTPTYQHHAVAEYSSYYVRDLKDKFNVGTMPNLPSGNNDYSISINKNFGFSPNISGRFMYVIKSEGRTWGKRLVEISNGSMTEYTIDNNQISGTSPIGFYNGDPLSIPLTDHQKLNILVFCHTQKDRLAYEALKLQLTDNIFNVYHGTNNTFLGHTEETSVNTGEFNNVSAVYHNWGQFLYDQSKDVVPGSGSNNQQPPLNPNCNPERENCYTPPTGPSGSTNPMYTQNTSTPQDQYGSLINESSIENPFEFDLDFPNCAGITNANDYAICVGDELTNDFQTNYANNNIFSAMTPFTPLFPFKATSLAEHKWSHPIFHEQYSKAISFRDDETPTSPFIDDDPDAPDVEIFNDENTKMYAISKKQKSKSKTRKWGIGLGLNFTDSVSELRDFGNIQTQDYFDVNGDNYPDMLYRDQAQLTGILGGLNDPLGRSVEGSGEHMISVSDDFMNSKSVSFGHGDMKTVGRDNGEPGVLDAVGDTSVSWSMGVGLSSDYPNSYNKNKEYWLDINGDGLVDKINKTSIKLNYGNGLVDNGLAGGFNGFEESYSKPMTSTSFSLGGSISSILDAVQGFQMGFAISGGLGGGSTTAESKLTYNDVNGDGLVDMLIVNGSSTAVRYNLGNRFDDPLNLSADFSRDSKTHSGHASLGGGYYVNIPIAFVLFVPVLYLKPIGADISASIGLSVNEINKGLRDVNGDGFPDLVENTDNGLKVHYSKVKRTNKLRKVSYEGVSDAFIINYGFSRPSYDDPNARLVMSEVTIPNPDAFSGNYATSTSGKNYVTTFKYENGRYDRREREFYGFGTVYTYDKDGSSTANTYRTLEQNFYNENYFINGLLKSSKVYEGTNSNNKLSESTNTYKLYNFNETVPGSSTYDATKLNFVADEQSGLFTSYDVGGTKGRKMGMVLPSGSTNIVYENGASITTQSALTYNNTGQLINYQYTSPSSSYNTAITYHTLSGNIRNVPKSVAVFSGTSTSNPLRSRSTLVGDPTKGDITKVRVALNNNQVAETDITYDAYGNIETITYPPNENGERHKLQYIYDDPLHKFLVEVKDLTPNFSFSSFAEYDKARDIMTKATDIAGKNMLYEYDAFRRVRVITGPKGEAITYQYFLSEIANGIKLFASKTSHYDEQNSGNWIETISFADFMGRVVQVKKDIEVDGVEKMSISGTTEYDNFGRAIKQQHPDLEDKDPQINNVISENLSTYFTHAIYDHKDRVIQSIDEINNLTENNFSIANNLMTTETTQFQSSSVQLKTEVLTNAEGKTVETINYLSGQPLSTQFQYNNIGELMRYNDPQGLETTFTYDMAGRRTSQLHPDRGLTHYEYNEAGQLISLMNANLEQNGLPPIHYNYYYNRLTEIILPDTPNGQNPNNVYYEYGSSGNDNGRLIHKTDGTGESYYEYGDMGEIINEYRTVYGYNMPTMNFSTSYQYDTWNRLKHINYPDNELVHYEYDLGGNLKRIFNEEGYEYVKEILYDHYEQRKQIDFGNGTSSLFSYELDTRRLENHTLNDMNGFSLLNTDYTYDFVGNIDTVNNTDGTPNGFSGNFGFDYGYDTLNRLVSATGNATPGEIREGTNPIPNPLMGTVEAFFETNLTYNDASGIETKNQYHSQDGNVNDLNTYDHQYEYFDDNHMLRTIHGNNGTENFEYDANGNMVYHVSEDGTTDDQLYWDEQDRLKAIFKGPQDIFQYYVYDDKGERTIKSNIAMDAQLYQNGVLMDSGITFDNYKVYPNPYVVVNSDGMYTKHYFAGSQRIASRLDYVNNNFQRQAPTTGTTLPKKTIADPEADFKTYMNKAGFENAKVKSEFARTAAYIDGLYYLHGDHLGTASLVTNHDGVTTQFFLNLPFGETMVEQQDPAYYHNPYKFNAKELDQETGLYYYGARYYNPRLSIWYGVDPLAIYQPVMETEFYGDGQHNGGVYFWGNLNPYIYTYQNPIYYIDPNGKQVENLFSKFNDPGELELKLPNTKTAQHQAFGVTVSGTAKNFNQIKESFKNNPQDFLTNSQATFHAPVNAKGEAATFEAGNFIKIDIDGPFNNAYVKILSVNENKKGEGGYLDATFGTMEGHMEKGKITFRLYDLGKGKTRFTINGLSEVDMGMAPEDISRSKQKESWNTVLDNFVKKTGGKEVEGSRVNKVVKTNNQ